MNTRTIQKTGGSSYTVTIPKSWIESQHLSEKDTLEYFASNSGPLCFRPAVQKNIRKTSLEIDYLKPDHVAREIYGMYVAGSEEIIVRAKNITPEQRAYIRMLSYKLIGFEIFESTTHTITLRNVSSSNITTKEYVQKIHTILLSMYPDVTQALRNVDIQLARDVIERDVEIDRIHMFINRRMHILLRDIIPTGQDSESLMFMQYYNLVTIRIEKIADHIVGLAYSLLMKKINDPLLLNKFELHAIESTMEYLRFLRDIIFQTDMRSAHKLLDLYHADYRVELQKKYVKNKSTENINIADNIDSIRSFCATIAEETIDFASVLALTQ